MIRMVIRLALLCLFISPVGAAITLAHEPGEEALITINNTPTKVHPVHALVLSYSELEIAHDRAANPIIINEATTFTINPDVLAEEYPSVSIAEAQYTWNFGDGTSASGETVTHAYADSGSYIVTVGIAIPGQEDEPSLEDVQVDVVPDQSYRIPEPQILINRIPFEGESIQVSLNSSLAFSVSGLENSQISTYTWDFGNGDTATGKDVQYTYQDKPQEIAPIVQIVTKDGFIITKYALASARDLGGATFSTSFVGAFILILELGALVIGGGIMLFLVWQEKRKIKQKR